MRGICLFKNPIANEDSTFLYNTGENDIVIQFLYTNKLTSNL